jgi:acyl-CoA synthetase (AMP-forming)/AMP-acid ligase II
MTIHSALSQPRTPSSGLSHVRGVDDQPLSKACLHELLAQAVQRWPERDAAIFCAEGIRWSWTEFQSQVNAAAATMDAEGYCNIVGRLKDMVIRGGENIYPREIEEFLFRHPKIAAVQVFGVPDQRYGEQLCAWVVQRPGAECTEQELRIFCEQNIAHFKVPRYIRMVEELPVTVTGKPQKFLMREAMVAELGLSRPASA